MTDDDPLLADSTDAPRLAHRRHYLRIALWTALGLCVLAAVAGSLAYTEKSSFCPTCHEMRPYYTAWQTGGHAARADCVDCHVNPGLLAHLAHKPAALKEVWDHFFADNRFPAYTAKLPDSRCVRCHQTVAEKPGDLFSHAKHLTRATCADCHLATGHVVTRVSLQAAGVLRTDATTPTIAGMKPSIIPGHPQVLCQRCHDQANMQCSTCHQPPHDNRGECSNCHLPGAGFAFAHPAGADCGACHKAPASHFGPACASCHSTSVPFAKTVFTHVAGAGCASCHKPPSTHFGSACASCHSPAVPFAKTVFKHVAGANCALCHKRPANHYGSSCSFCHTPGVPFAQAKFKHSAGANCGSCHKAPAKHYGSSCSSCHRPTVAFSKATFRHPARVGEHSFRSFACVKCHPNGYTSSSCTCHGGRAPSGD